MKIQVHASLYLYGLMLHVATNLHIWTCIDFEQVQN